MKVAVLKTEKYGVNDILAVKVEKALQPHILQGEEVQVCRGVTSNIIITVHW